MLKYITPTVPDLCAIFRCVFWKMDNVSSAHSNVNEVYSLCSMWFCCVKIECTIAALTTIDVIINQTPNGPHSFIKILNYLLVACKQNNHHNRNHRKCLASSSRRFIGSSYNVRHKWPAGMIFVVLLKCIIIVIATLTGADTSSDFPIKSHAIHYMLRIIVKTKWVVFSTSIIVRLFAERKTKPAVNTLLCGRNLYCPASLAIHYCLHTQTHTHTYLYIWVYLWRENSVSVNRLKWDEIVCRLSVISWVRNPQFNFNPAVQKVCLWRFICVKMNIITCTTTIRCFHICIYFYWNYYT